MASSDIGQCHRGTFVCRAGHELRVTERCIVEDLIRRGDRTFASLLGHEIVKAFRDERAASVRGSSTVGPAAGDDTLWVLRRTDDHRGATWFDVEERVVWLCAYAPHRSGEPDDAFPYFEELRKAARIRPTTADYQALYEDRAEQFVAVVSAQASELLGRARSQLGVEIRATIGHTEQVGLLVHVIETLEETYLVLSRADPVKLQLLQAALYPDRPLIDWRWEQRLPTRDLDRRNGEYCCSILHG